MGLSVFFCLVFNSVGLGISYSYDLPSGPTIIVLAGVVYLAAAVLCRLFRKSSG
jgi:ABC-type Mn2+/Zn2+ transport system permease subunit